MKVALVNLPWYLPEKPDLWGVRAGSRWPHFQKRAGSGKLPRYIPFPFFMAISAAILKERKHGVLLIDAIAEGIEEQVVFDRITDFGPDIIFAETSTPSLGSDVTLLKELKCRNPRAVFVCAGTHAPGLALDLMQRNGLPDYWLVGEYELVLAELVARIEKKGVVSLPGVLTENDSVPASIPDLSVLPEPLYKQLPVRNYSDPVCGLPSPSAQTWLSRGCPFGCTFCVWPQLVYGNRHYRTRPIRRALDEVCHLIENYGCESFYFDDDTTNIGETRMLELCKEIKVRGLDKYPWAMMARADCMTDRMLDALADAGMYSVKYGVESISEKMLDACNKGTNIERFHRALGYTSELGIKMHLTFTFGVPGETVETIRETLVFALETAPETAQFSICTPFPGTAIYEECKQNGWLVTRDWTRYIGSDEVVVETPWLKASVLKLEYERALEEWSRFVDRRLNERRLRLKCELQRRVAEGRKWMFFGDRDFAGFLFGGDSALLNAFQEEGPLPGLVDPVLVSRHDEELLWRRMKRENNLAAARALRLYG